LLLFRPVYQETIQNRNGMYTVRFSTHNIAATLILFKCTAVEAIYVGELNSLVNTMNFRHMALSQKNPIRMIHTDDHDISLYEVETDDLHFAQGIMDAMLKIERNA
jgi:hypothetical protein